MFGSIKRVISNSDEFGNQIAETTRENQPQSCVGQSPESQSAVVEPDFPMDISTDAPLEIIDPNQSDKYASSSTLSDASERKDDTMMEDDEEETPAKEDSAVLNRMDSMNDSSSGSQRASSQNSSRDWGWFEDVHQVSDTNLTASEKKTSLKSERQGLVPHASGSDVQQVIHQNENGESPLIVVIAFRSGRVQI